MEKELAVLGYEDTALSHRVMLNLDFARANMKANIYNQAVLEGMATTYPQTETIIENGIVSGMTTTAVQKILNLKHTWKFILDKNVLSHATDYNILCHIAKLVNEGFYTDGVRIRGVPVAIDGTSYIPPLPIETVVTENIEAILRDNVDEVDTAIRLCLYCMKTQIFNDGQQAGICDIGEPPHRLQETGLIVIPESHVPEFKQLLVAYYEDQDNGEIVEFMRSKCWRTFKLLGTF